MGVHDAFAAFQRDVVNAEFWQVKRAQERRDAFAGALTGEPDVAEVLCAGSFGRGTQLQPLHDVDMVVVFNTDDHPDWGAPGPSSEAAMRHAQARVTALLGVSSGTHQQLVRRTRVSGRGRSVKCFIDTTDTTDTDSFTVDVMPVLRQGPDRLLLPSQHEELWSPANPELLITEVQDRHDRWIRYRPTVRLLKWWAREQVSVRVKSLVTEVLALHYLPTDAGNVAEALRRFFLAAAANVSDGVEDPAGYCGVIDPDLDDERLRAALELAADHAEKAVAAVARNDQPTALAHWRAVLGPQFAPDDPDTAAGGPGSSSTGAAPVTPRRPVRDAPQG